MATIGGQKRKKTAEDMELKLMEDVELELMEAYRKRNKISSMKPLYKSLVSQDPLRLCIEDVEIYCTDFHFYQTKILKNFYKKVIGSRDVDELFCSGVLESIFLDRKDEDPKLDEERRHELFPSKRFKMSCYNTLDIQVMGSQKSVGWLTLHEVKSLGSGAIKKVIDYVEDDARSDLEMAERTKAVSLHEEESPKHRQLKIFLSKGAIAFCLV